MGENCLIDVIHFFSSLETGVGAVEMITDRRETARSFLRMALPTSHETARAKIPFIL